MLKPVISVIAVLFLSVTSGFSQADPMMVSLSIEVGKISRSVSTMSEKFALFVDKMDKAPTAAGAAATERQQRLAAGLQLLANTELLLMTRQRSQIELTEKQGQARQRLAQVERDVMPTSIDRSVQFEGTTRTEELRENRRTALNAERAALQTSLALITTTLAEQTEMVREAQGLVNRLRRQYIPELEREIDR